MIESLSRTRFFRSLLALAVLLSLVTAAAQGIDQETYQAWRSAEQHPFAQPTMVQFWRQDEIAGYGPSIQQVQDYLVRTWRQDEIASYHGDQLQMLAHEPAFQAWHVSKVSGCSGAPATLTYRQ